MNVDVLIGLMAGTSLGFGLAAAFAQAREERRRRRRSARIASIVDKYEARLRKISADAGRRSL